MNQTQQTVLAGNASWADTVFSRLKGLLGRQSIGPDEALVITHCRSIHMFFMRFAIDVVFVDKKNIVVGCVRDMQPFQMSPYFIRSFAAIELPAGKIAASRTQTGDTICFEEQR